MIKIYAAIYIFIKLIVSHLFRGQKRAEIFALFKEQSPRDEIMGTLKIAFIISARLLTFTCKVILGAC